MSWELKTSFVLGMLHSLEPGHGKTAMLAMMLDQRKKWIDSFSLALSAVLSHSALMLIIALITHFGSHIIVGDDLNHFFSDHLKILGPIFLMIIGSFLLFNSRKSHKKCCSHHNNQEESSSKIPILLGISIGLYPCPTLIATYVSSVSHGELNLGIAAVALFTLGSFISILLSAVFLKYIGSKVTGSLEEKAKKLNWKKIQGILIIMVGLVAFVH